MQFLLLKVSEELHIDTPMIWLDGSPSGRRLMEGGLRALVSTIGTNVTIDGFKGGTGMSSSWRKMVPSEAIEPFSGD